MPEDLSRFLEVNPIFQPDHDKSQDTNPANLISRPSAFKKPEKRGLLLFLALL
jgi:hypothetical protein